MENNYSRENADAVEITDYSLVTYADKATSVSDLFPADVPAFSSNEFLERDGSTITVDAVHPLFTQVFGSRRKRDVATSTTEDRCQLYLCVQCDCFVYKTLLDITNHFIRYEHKPENLCVYCAGPVFTYYANGLALYHHKCNSINPSNCDQLDRSKSNGTLDETSNS